MVWPREIGFPDCSLTPNKNGCSAAEAAYKKAGKYLSEDIPERFSNSIGQMEWGLSRIFGTIGPKTLERLISEYDNKGLNATLIKYLSMYLPIHPFDRESGKGYVNLTIDNLPADAKTMSRNDQTKFVLMTLAIIHQETKFGKSPMQVVYRTANAMDGNKNLPRDEYRKIEPNIRVGTAYLWSLIKSKGGNINDRNLRLYAFRAYHNGAAGARNPANNSYYERIVEAKYQLYLRLFFRQTAAVLEGVACQDRPK